MDRVQAAIYGLLAAAVVVVGARWELQRHRWGEAAWRAMMIALVLAAVVVGWALWRESEAPAPPPPLAPAGDSLAV